MVRLELVTPQGELLSLTFENACKFSTDDDLIYIHEDREYPAEVVAVYGKRHLFRCWMPNAAPVMVMH